MQSSHNLGSTFIKYALQPLLLVSALSLWYLYQESLIIYPIILIGVQILLGIIEYQLPARPDWLPPAKEKTGVILLVVFIFFYSAMIAAPLYDSTLNPVLSSLRSSMGINIWPHEWPMIAQVVLAFFLSELIWYWFH